MVIGSATLLYTVKMRKRITILAIQKGDITHSYVITLTVCRCQRLVRHLLKLSLCCSPLLSLAVVKCKQKTNICRVYRARITSKETLHSLLGNIIVKTHRTNSQSILHLLHLILRREIVLQLQTHILMSRICITTVLQQTLCSVEHNLLIIRCCITPQHCERRNYYRKSSKHIHTICAKIAIFNITS